MPTLGGLLKKKRTKDSFEPPTTSSSGATADTANSSLFSSALGTVSSNSSAAFSEQKAEAAEPVQPSNAPGPTSAPKDADVGNPKAQQPVYAPAQDTPKPRDMATPASQSTGGAATTNPARQTKGKYTLTDFALQRTLGTGSFGRVHLVQSKHNSRFYAIKVLKKTQVVKMKQVEHTNDERKMLQKVKHPFLVTLWGTFQDSKNLYMVMDFVEGGELFSLLRKSQVRLRVAGPTTPFLTTRTALPEPGRQVLRSRSHPRARLSALIQHHLSRPEARKPVA